MTSKIDIIEAGKRDGVAMLIAFVDGHPTYASDFHGAGLFALTGVEKVRLCDSAEVAGRAAFRREVARRVARNV